VSESLPPPPVLPTTAEALLTFLDSVGRRSEAELYLRLFRELPRESFAVIAVEPSLVQKNGGAIAEQLRFLCELGLSAALVVGLFDPEETASEARRLARRLRTAGLVPREVTPEDDKLASLLRSTLRDGELPVLGFGEIGWPVEKRVAVVEQLMNALHTRKLVILRQRGALGGRLERPIELLPGRVLPTNNDGISVINLRTDLTPLRSLLDADDAELLEELASLLVHSPELEVNVTSPLSLLRELFTVRGAGTFVKRGTEVQIYTSYEELDRPRLTQLLESSFRKRLVPGFFDHPLLRVYLEPGYHAAAIIEPSAVAPVLSKFAVDPLAQGAGLGRDLWDAFTQDFPSIIWRARSTNPICSWYAWQCQGLVRGERWTTYFRGIPASEVPRVIEEMLSRPEDFSH